MELGDVIARRVLEKDGRTYEVRIARPRTDEASGDWICTFSLVDESESPVFSIDVWGCDSVQALTSALTVIGERLAAESTQFTFMGLPDTGFLRLLPPEQSEVTARYLPMTDYGL